MVRRSIARLVVRQVGRTSLEQVLASFDHAIAADSATTKPFRLKLANWKTFGAMLARDAHVARRNAIQLLMQTFLQPLLFVFIFGKVMVGSGYMP